MVQSDWCNTSSDDSVDGELPEERIKVIFVVLGQPDELNKFLELVESWKWTVRDHHDGKNNREASATFLLDEATMFIDYLLKSDEARKLDVFYGWKQLKGDNLEGGFTRFRDMENGLLRSMRELKEKYSYTAVVRHRLSLENEERRLKELEEIRNTKLTIDDLSVSSGEVDKGGDNGDKKNNGEGTSGGGMIGNQPPEFLRVARASTPTQQSSSVASGEGPCSPRKKKSRGA